MLKIPINARSLLCAGALLAALPLRASGASPSLEYEVKAAFLYNFAKFVEWPADAFAAPDSDFVFCVVGDDPFDGLLERAVADRTAAGRRIAVKNLPATVSPAGCHLVFIPASESVRTKSILAALEPLRTAATLTVGESERFTEEQGMVRLLIEEGHVRFEVNVAAAESAGLRLSSQILKLARDVKR